MLGRLGIGVEGGGEEGCGGRGGEGRVVVVGESEVVRFSGGCIEPVSTDTLLFTSFFAVLPFSFRAFVFLRSARLFFFFFFFLVADTCDSRAVFFIFSSPFLLFASFSPFFGLSLVCFSLLLSLGPRPLFLRALVLFLFLLCRSYYWYMRVRANMCM